MMYLSYHSSYVCMYRRFCILSLNLDIGYWTLYVTIPIPIPNFVGFLIVLLLGANLCLVTT